MEILFISFCAKSSLICALQQYENSIYIFICWSALFLCLACGAPEQICFSEISEQIKVFIFITMSQNHRNISDYFVYLSQHGSPEAALQLHQDENGAASGEYKMEIIFNE